MPKKKKTLKQKKLSDMRRETTTNRPQNSSPEKISYTTQASSAPVSKPAPQETKPKTILTHEYRYLTFDLLKTAVVTGVIVILEILSRYLYRGV